MAGPRHSLQRHLRRRIWEGESKKARENVLLISLENRTQSEEQNEAMNWRNLERSCGCSQVKPGSGARRHTPRADGAFEPSWRWLHTSQTGRFLGTTAQHRGRLKIRDETRGEAKRGKGIKKWTNESMNEWMNACLEFFLFTIVLWNRGGFWNTRAGR